MPCHRLLLTAAFALLPLSGSVNPFLTGRAVIGFIDLLALDPLGQPGGHVTINRIKKR